MGNIIDYARTETRGFDSLPFRAADALVLAQLSYDDVPDCVATLDELTKRYGTIGHRARHFSLRRPIASLKALRHPPFDGVTIAPLTPGTMVKSAPPQSATSIRMEPTGLCVRRVHRKTPSSISEKLSSAPAHGRIRATVSPPRQMRV